MLIASRKITFPLCGAFVELKQFSLNASDRDQPNILYTIKIFLITLDVSKFCLLQGSSPDSFRTFDGDILAGASFLGADAAGTLGR